MPPEPGVVDRVVDSLQYLVGFGVVLSTLAVMWGACALMARVVQLIAPAPQPRSAPPVATPAAEDPRLVAVVAAAVATMIDLPHRVVAIRPASLDWGREGRRQIFSSHNLR